MKKHYRIPAFFVLIGLAFACSKTPVDYKKFLNDEEIVYPGAISEVTVSPGKYRLMLQWHPSPDPSVTKYVIYWNNYADSLTVQAASHDPGDTVSCVIDKLQEYNYTFFINAFDADGNKSIIQEINNARVYGSLYQDNLTNRPVNLDAPFVLNDDLSTLSLRFFAPDTINVNTIVTYTNLSGQKVQATLMPSVDTILLTGYKIGTPILYRSAYVPKKQAIDTFQTAQADTFPTIFKLIMCDKSKFSAVHFPYDVGLYQSGTDLAKLWDGNATVRDYPNIFHSDDPGASTPGGTMPRSLSFDMGAAYNNISAIEEIGRGCCNNPVDFEIWGIADTTGATPTLRSNDPNWKSMIQQKGWTLLTQAIRNDNGVAPQKFNFILNPPPVRFIIMRILKVVNGPNSINMSQLTFWYKLQ